MSVLWSAESKENSINQFTRQGECYRWIVWNHKNCADWRIGKMMFVVASWFISFGTWLAIRACRKEK